MLSLLVRLDSEEMWLYLLCTLQVIILLFPDVQDLMVVYLFVTICLLCYSVIDSTFM